MNPKAATFVCGVILIFALTSIHLPAQDSGTVSGTVTDPAGKPVPNAKVSIKDATNGQSSEAQTDSAGHYTFSNLAQREITKYSAQSKESVRSSLR